MRTSRIAAALLLAATLPRPAVGQEAASEGPASYRKYVYAAAGAAVLGGLASFAREGHPGAFCATKSCLVPLGVTAGTLVGYMLGSDLDERARARWTGAPTIDVRRSDVGLDAPVRLAEHPEGAVALETERVTLLTAALSTRPLMMATRTRDAVALPARSILLVAGDEGVWGIPFSGGSSQRVREEGATGIASLPQSELALARRNGLERAVLSSSSGGGLGLEGRASATIAGVPQALASVGDMLWVVVDSMLEGRRAGSLERTGGLSLGGYGADLAVASDVALVAVGSGGVAVVDISDAASPRELARLTNMGRAYAVAIAGGEAYVAAGGQGVFVYDVSQPGSPRLVGVIADVGLATDVASSEGALWVLDRTGRRVIRIDGAGGLGARAAGRG